MEGGVRDPRYLFNETANASNGWGTLSYTSEAIMATGPPNSAAISYRQFGAYIWTKPRGKDMAWAKHKFREPTSFASSLAVALVPPP
jgi:hypothetical protein